MLRKLYEQKQLEREKGDVSHLSHISFAISFLNMDLGNYELSEI